MNNPIGDRLSQNISRGVANFRENRASDVEKSVDGKKIFFKLECGPMPNLMAAQPYISGALCESSVIPFLVPRRKVWLTPAAGVPYNARRGRKVNFAPGKIPSGGKIPRKCIYSVPALETAKHPAKFGWPVVRDVAAITKARRETR